MLELIKSKTSTNTKASNSKSKSSNSSSTDTEPKNKKQSIYFQTPSKYQFRMESNEKRREAYTIRLNGKMI